MTRIIIFLATQLPIKNFDIFLPLILRLWKITRVCNVLFKKIQFIFYACFLSRRPSLTRNTIFLATQLPIKSFDIFLPLILRLWKITRVCDIFLKNILFIFYACFLSSRPSLTRNTIFLTTQLPIKNFNIFFALDIATMEDNLRV